MKAIWSSCTRAFSLPGLKRGRGDDPPDLALPGSKRAKSEHSKIMKNLDVDGDDTQTQCQPQLKPNMINSSPATLIKSKSKEEREGIFSSLPLTFFSPSVPQSTINQFMESGGLTLPRLDPMELQYYFRSPLKEDHPFYHVDLIFVTGPEDLLGIVLRRRVLVYYDCRWVRECIERGELLGLEGYVVEFPIFNNIRAEVEGGSERVVASRLNNNQNGNSGRQLISDMSDPPLSIAPSIKLTDNLLKYTRRAVHPSAFTSESALRDASFHHLSTSIPRLRAATAPSTRPRPTPINAIVGPSKSKDESESQELEQTFIPFDTSSQQMSRSATPQLYIPFKVLDRVKVEEFDKRIKECKVHDLEEFYQDLMECGKDDKIITGLEAGLLV